jgi:hypothetical protein
MLALLEIGVSDGSWIGMVPLVVVEAARTVINVRLPHISFSA